ncbi:hypothetical protein IC229_08900 [Spirosoma sp. BT702]|uniref:Uncharacterized protein n=1 Tax=Spirosoma profusum TaxID=2771354 RepID=A0A927AQL0_9BACT|nr:DUF5908 family protein [Spirosoma profusum]MBD2700753.1 hypothetical protein [Spirosoma profusum]
MPIEIRELIIRARVEEIGAANPAQNGGRNSQNTMAEREAIVAACVEQVLKILADKQER